MPFLSSRKVLYSRQAQSGMLVCPCRPSISFSRLQQQAPRHSRCRVVINALQEQQIEFLNHRSEKLVGTLCLPSSEATNTTRSKKSTSEASSSSKPPVVLLAHGYMSTRNSELLMWLSIALAKCCQLSSLRFDFSGNGDSEGSFKYGQYKSEAEDLRCAKQALEQQMGRRVIAMIGHSKGATDVLLYAAKYDDVPCAVSLAARFEVQKGVLERLGPEVLQRLDSNGQVEMSGRSSKGLFKWMLRKEDLQDRLSTDMEAACNSIHHAAVCIVHGDADADVPIADAYKIDKALKQCSNKQLVVLEGADHCFTSQGAMYQLAEAVLPFVSQHADTG